MEDVVKSEEKFWASERPEVLVNHRDASAGEEAKKIRHWLDEEAGDLLEGHLLFATSGSTGKKKWVALSKTALLVSAREVNLYLEVTPKDIWLQCLPSFHVGGMGIRARAFVAGGEYVQDIKKWSPESLCDDLVKKGVSLLSLVPTQLVDLVRLGCKAPGTLRSVLIGGGRLDDEIYERATALGWPVRETYGMTEAASQVATASLGSRTLNLLPCWEAMENEEGRLLIKGVPLMTGYVECGEDGVSFVDPKKNQWFLTNDKVEVKGKKLNVLGRFDRCVKMLGELVHLDDVERQVAASLREKAVCFKDIQVVAIEDQRRGAKLTLCVEGGHIPDSWREYYNQQCYPLHRINAIDEMDAFPRSPLGKVLMQELKERIL